MLFHVVSMKRQAVETVAFQSFFLDCINYQRKFRNLTSDYTDVAAEDLSTKRCDRADVIQQRYAT